jgi:hypothetical protein
MKIEGIIILVLVFAVITISIGGIVGDMRNNYDVNVSTSWENQYNFANEINNSVSEIQTDINAAGESKGFLSVLSGASAIWSGIKTTAKLITSIPGYTIAIIRGVASNMGLPPVVSDVIIPIFIVMVIVLMIFAAIRLIRGDSV